MLKRAKVAVIAALIITGLLAAPAFAAPKVKATKVDSVKCKATNAVGHPPMEVGSTYKTLKRLPRTITLQTNCGDIVISTVGAKAIVTISQIASLARGGFYNDSLCHRLTTQGAYILQCGDPTATGGGGPKFTYRDENLPANTVNNYPAGTVAMANRGLASDGSATNGSQFFLVFADTTLGPNYSIWGTITQGIEIVKAIAKAGVKGGGLDGTPNQSIAILRVVVTN